MPYSGSHTRATPLSGRLGVVLVATTCLSVLLVLVLALYGYVSFAGAPTGPRAAPAKDPPTASPAEQQTSERGVTAKSSHVPVELTIPAIKVAADITSLGLNKDETVEVPGNADKVGWYSLGTTPGQVGSAVLLGHVDSERGPAVFYRLRDLEQGDRLAVHLSADTVTHFEVTRVVSYANEDFPARKVYAGSPDRPTLNLVTCGGNYDKSAGGYQSNVVAYTKYLWSTRT